MKELTWRQMKSKVNSPHLKSVNKKNKTVVYSTAKRDICNGWGVENKWQLMTN